MDLKQVLNISQDTFDWNQVLSDNEELKFECGLSKQYLDVGFVISLAIGGLLILVFIGILIIPWAFVYWKFYLNKAFRYALTNRRVLVHKGWLNTNLISVDFRKITDVQVRENFIEKQLFNIGSVIINTAGTSYHEVIIDKIADPYAFKKTLESLRNQHLHLSGSGQVFPNQSKPAAT